MPDLFIKRYENVEDPRLGRIVVHDPASRGWVHPSQPDKSTWHDKIIRIYDPVPNPNQTVGNCTMCAKAMQLNAVGNRVKGRILDMPWAMKWYEWETANDEFPGQYNPNDPANSQDTGSSGLASCKTAIQAGVGAEYLWLFAGADQVVQAIMDGDVVNVGTDWQYDMFNKDSQGRIHLGGGVAGGHEYVLHGYSHSRDWIRGRCWWGGFKDFWIARADLDTLLQNYGDAHVQKSV